ncbi:hypothetical protein SAMN04488109_4760 [Chryseolinea serpens]|uniref:Uncharacterized protein n=1 Tax=Chryseolinea serpens TaxID=947013 RepID=A0A1M5ULG9_9BACT|nr:hypothetical protein [Chryseolinea serpens]SHH63770.1 hypothetical protein SAMN04488109_4760 [Chryseolinea serpens]
MKTKIIFRKVPIDPTRKRIYLNDVAWYYEDDPCEKQKMEAAVATLEKIDFSKLRDENKKTL